MKPETYNLWEKALVLFEEAEELSKGDKFQEAEWKATEAFVAAMQAINALSRELEMSDLSIIVENAGLEWLELENKHYRPKEMLEWIRRRLKRLSDDLPPDTFRPFR
jgi:hypothetical protein